MPNAGLGAALISDCRRQIRARKRPYNVKKVFEDVHRYERPQFLTPRKPELAFDVAGKTCFCARTF